jgi:enamine deaminase RidA (YjgF/YER057c/UK114 family)
MSVTDKIAELGYTLEPMPLQRRSFYVAVRTGSLVFTSGQLPQLGTVEIKGLVGENVDERLAQKAAEICAVNCLRAIAAVTNIDRVARIVKVFGMVNVADGFTNTPAVINGATDLFNRIFGAENTHARSAVGMRLPDDWAVEVEVVAELEP